MNDIPRITGFSACSPVTCLTNQDLEQRIDTSDEWIVTRTGIRQRHILAAGEQLSTLAAEAARKALDSAQISPSSLTHVVVATCTPDTLSPSLACTVAGLLGLPCVMAFDINAGCTGFLYAVSLCRSILAADPSACILLLGAEAISRRLNWQDRTTCVLFGDGAGACVMNAGQQGSTGTAAAVVDVLCTSDGANAHMIKVGGGSARSYAPGDPVHEDFFVSMHGRDVFKHAVRNMVDSARQILERNGLAADDIDLFIPHQANQRIIDAVGTRLNIAPEKIFSDVASYGNTSAASIPLALADAGQSGLLRPGMKVLLGAFGSGLTWGSVLLQF
ncbi:MAG: ketoacyl-ACP synthase III [Desulfovibrionaceae bacterium]|nr:ketoacyl-ACP synthase III [Desulfovibrionaceae bacterium]